MTGDPYAQSGGMGDRSMGDGRVPLTPKGQQSDSTVHATPRSEP